MEYHHIFSLHIYLEFLKEFSRHVDCYRKLPYLLFFNHLIHCI
jgi:hypothetical protein